MKVCPKCGREFDRLLAVSRVDNRTMICDTCGNMEALEAMGGRMVTRRKALKAYNLIKKYCLQGECKGCLFEMDECDFILSYMKQVGLYWRLGLRLLGQKGKSMDNKKKTINLVVAMELQKKELAFEKKRAKRMYAYNCAVKRMLRNA